MRAKRQTRQCRCGECNTCLRNRVERLEHALRRTVPQESPDQTILVRTHRRRNWRKPVDTSQTQQAAKELFNHLGSGFLKGLLKQR